MKFLRVLVLAIFLPLVASIMPAKADPEAVELKGLHALVNSEYPQASLIWGFIALNTNVLEYM